MKTLSEHNNESRLREEAVRSVLSKTGVACDTCKAEMLLRDPGTMNASSPPSQWVYCPKCGATGLLRN